MLHEEAVRLGGIALAWVIVSCSPTRPRALTAPEPGTVARAPRSDTAGSAAPATLGDSTRNCAIADCRGVPAEEAHPEPPRLLPLETTCDGTDEDGDGHPDMLIPTGANACTTNAKGACGQGWAACLGGKWVCDTPPPMPEVADGIDNDCNGAVDDVAPTRTHARALVLGPSYIWTDAKSDIDSVTTALDQAGVAYDVQPPNTDWASEAATFARYSLLIIPGYLEGVSVDDNLLASLETFAMGGGVVFVMKPIASPDRVGSLQLAGIKSAKRSRQATALRILETEAVAFSAIDSPEERDIALTRDAKRKPIDVWTFEVDDKTQVLATAYAGSTPLGPVATRRPVGRGAVYAWGHDLSTLDATRCYVNCFEPSGDLLRLFLRDALREGTQGHIVLKHPIAGGGRSTLVLTHDVDAVDAYGEGPWGDPGALQMAAMEKANGVWATYYFTTDVAGNFKPDVVEKLCAAGFCPAGAHSVRHLRSFGQHPRGTCRENTQTYGPKTPATLCGEVRVSLDILGKLANERPHAWRSPYLASNRHLFDVLADCGVTLDSSFGVGDLKYNLPVDTTRSPNLQHLFHHRALVEFPITGEDGTNVSTRERTEMQAHNLAWFVNAWEYAMLRNAQNTSITTLLVRPSRGESASDDTIKAKVGAVEHIVQVAKAHGILVDSLIHFGDFWRARQGVVFDASYDPFNGYTGWFQTGDEPLERLTFEFGDAIRSFECAACGKVTINATHVVMTTKLAPRTRAMFTAMPRAVAQ